MGEPMGWGKPPYGGTRPNAVLYGGDRPQRGFIWGRPPPARFYRKAIVKGYPELFILPLWCLKKELSFYKI